MLFVTSCGSDFLDKVPEGSYVEDNYYASDDAVAAATGPLYNRAWFDFNQRSINPMGSARANDVYSPYNFKSFTLFTVDALDSDLSSAWTGIFFEFIIRDLEFAAKYLPETPAATGRATCWSAKAMLAKTYLARSGWGKSTRDQEDLDKCKELCLDVIENSGSVLMENYHDLFKYRHNNNIECLLALQWYASADGPWYVKNALLSDLCADSK